MSVTCAIHASTAMVSAMVSCANKPGVTINDKSGHYSVMESLCKQQASGVFQSLNVCTRTFYCHADEWSGIFCWMM